MSVTVQEEIDLSGSWSVAQLPDGTTELPELEGLEWLVCTKDWIFRRSFTLDEGAVGAGLLSPEFVGVDTFADIWLNGSMLGQSVNAYRSHRFPLPPLPGRVGSGISTLPALQARSLGATPRWGGAHGGGRDALGGTGPGEPRLGGFAAARLTLDPAG
jgi:hypothetical protein